MKNPLHGKFDEMVEAVLRPVKRPVKLTESSVGRRNEPRGGL